jgi:hypothetical protein
MSKGTALLGAFGIVVSLAGCGGGGLSTDTAGRCPTIFTEQHINLSGKIAEIVPFPVVRGAGGIYLALVTDSAGLPCEVVTRERPPLGAQTTFTNYVAHRDDKGTTTEFLYPAKSPELATAMEPTP